MIYHVPPPWLTQPAVKALVVSSRLQIADSVEVSMPTIWPRIDRATDAKEPRGAEIYIVSLR